MRTAVMMSATLVSVRRFRRRMCRTAQARSQMMTARVVAPDSGPTPFHQVRKSAKLLLTWYTTMIRPRAKVPTPAAMAAAAAGPSGLSMPFTADGGGAMWSRWAWVMRELLYRCDLGDERAQ